MATAQRKKAKAKRSSTAADRQPYVLRLPPDLHAALRIVAAARRRSLNELLLEVLQAWWERQPERGSVERLSRRKSR